MKTYILKILLLATLFLGSYISSLAKNPLRFRSSINYYRDLSDTYGGGGLLSGEIEVSENWYGLAVCFGNFQSQSTFVLRVPIPEINSFLAIPIDEISIMQIGTISGLIKPINKKWIAADILMGLCLNRSKSLFFKEVEYSYNLYEHKFTRLIKDYQLVKTKHLGYQLGIDISFFVNQKLGFKLSARMQDLNKGGSFFFVGGGFCFDL